MQYSTGWVLACIGRAYFEMVDYKSAAEAFEWARKADPSRLEVLSLRLNWPLPSLQAQGSTWRSCASVLPEAPAAKLRPCPSPCHSQAEHSLCPEPQQTGVQRAGASDADLKISTAGNAVQTSQGLTELQNLKMCSFARRALKRSCTQTLSIHLSFLSAWHGCRAWSCTARYCGI